MSKVIYLEFGIDELAVILSLTDRLREAKALLFGRFGEISDEEERGRLLAAHNSLLARGIIFLNGDKLTLDPNVKNIIDIFSQSKKIIRFSKSTKIGEELISYYEYRDVYLEHSVIQGVAHRFYYPVDSPAIEEKAQSFFSPVSSPKKRNILIDIPSSKILNMPIGSLVNHEEVLALLSNGEETISKELQQLAADIVNAEWRGVTTWINHPDADYLLTKGYLWVQGKDILWTINSVNHGDSSRLRAETCSKKEFSQKIGYLIRTDSDFEKK